MIKFFRHIRQRLLSENKFSKYLIYAIGEIVLVVIGILIALQINNWNENRKNEDLEIAYLKGIQSNLVNDIDELERHFKGDTLKLDALSFLLRTTEADVENSQVQTYISNSLFVSKEHWFEGQNVVFEDMKSSGKLNLLQSERIKLSTQIYYRLFVETIKHEDINNQFYRNYIENNSELFKVYPLVEEIFPKRWKSGIKPVNFSLTYFDLSETEIDKVLDNYSLMKARLYSSHMARLRLYQYAKQLEELIEGYLEEKK